jgi:hypothetical protein
MLTAQSARVDRWNTPCRQKISIYSRLRRNWRRIYGGGLSVAILHEHSAVGEQVTSFWTSHSLCSSMRSVTLGWSSRNRNTLLEAGPTVLQAFSALRTFAFTAGKAT